MGRITNLEVSAYTIPTEVPEADGTLEWHETTLVLVQPSDDEGHRGLGYAYGTEAMVAFIRQVLEPVIVGADPEQVRGAWKAMVHAIRNLGRPGVSSMAISAVDIALWDLHARRHDMPLHHLLGAVTDRVDAYGSGGFTTYSDEQLEAQLQEFLEAGLRAAKIKVGTDNGRRADRDVVRLELCRRVLGDAPLMMDANGAFSAAEAIRFGSRASAEFGVCWFEEPVSSDDLSGMAEVRSHLDAEVAAGEYGYDLVYFRRMLEARSVGCMQADAGRCGGITEWMRVAALCAAHGIDLSSHCGPSLHQHVAAATPNFRHAEYFHDHARIEHLLFDGAATPHDGWLIPDASSPGMGLVLRQSDAERWRVA